jgi:GT2 family glycosyltransferase
VGQAPERLVVLVLSHDKRAETLRCLDSVARLRYRPREVLLVDNGSSDGSADAIAKAHPEVHLLRSPVNLGAAGGRNLGIRAAEERFAYGYMLFLDDDTVVDERLADELVAALRADPGVGLATPKAYRLGEPGVIASAGGMRVRLGRGSIVDVGAGVVDRGQFDRSGPVDSCVGFAVLARREALLAVRGFDERYNPYGWEEVDFSLRVRRAGFSIRYVPAAVAYHGGGTPGRGCAVPAYERGKSANYLRLMRAYASPLEWAGFALSAPVRASVVLFRQIARGEWRAAAARVWGFVGGLRRG